MESEIFDLEKIKDLIEPIDLLQGKLTKLDMVYDKYKEISSLVLKIMDNQDFLDQFDEINKVLDKLNRDLHYISNQNLTNFLFFHDLLIQKYKESFKESLKVINITQDHMKELGLSFIENRKIHKIIRTISYIPSLSLDEWLELLSSLKLNSIFFIGVEKIEKFFKIKLESKLKLELEKIPEDIDKEIIEKFKATYENDPLSFQDFLQQIENQLSAEELKKKRKIIEDLKNKELLEKMKKKQEDQFHSKTYQEYIHLPDEEFERRRRKQRREKLSELAEKPAKEIELSEDVVEKIEKFKSQFEKKFEEDYLIKKDDDMDPLELIRERDKKKKEEYQKFINKFKKED